MYTTVRKRRQESSQQFYACYLVLILISCAATLFFAYRFFTKIRGDRSYSIGSGNKYVNLITNSFHGEADENSKEELVDLESVREKNNQVVNQFVLDFQSQVDGLTWKFDPKMESTTLRELIRKDSDAPIVIFSALENPMNPIGSKAPDVSMQCMSSISLPNLHRLFFSKSVVVKNLVKGHSKVVRDTSFLVNPDKYILMKSLLSRIGDVVKSSKENTNHSGGLFVYLDVNSYIAPELLSHLLSILRSTIVQSPKPILITARTVTVSTLNKRFPYQGITEDSIESAQHQFDVLIFNEATRSILLESMPEGAITLECGPLILSIASQHSIEVIDASPLIFVVKKKVIYHSKEKPFLLTNSALQRIEVIPIVSMDEICHESIQGMTSNHLRIAEEIIPFSNQTRFLVSLLRSGMVFHPSCSFFATSFLSPIQLYLCDTIHLYVDSSLCQEWKLKVMRVQEPSISITCVYAPASTGKWYFKSIGTLPSASLVVVNTDANEAFIPLIDTIMERRGRTVIVSEDDKFVTSYIKGQYNVLEKFGQFIVISD